MERKTTYTRGAFRDQAAFERVTEEFKVPPEIVLRGLDAVIQWINESKEPLRNAAIGAALLALFAPMDRPTDVQPGIAGDAELKREKWSWAWLEIFMPPERAPLRGAVLNETITVRVLGDYSIRKISTELIQSVIRIDKNSHLIEYADGSRITVHIETDPILFRTHGVRTIIGGKSPEVHKLHPGRVKSIMLGSFARSQLSSTVASRTRRCLDRPQL